jgi:DNA repair exonuclease SbcCD ATPase subunit
LCSNNARKISKKGLSFDQKKDALLNAMLKECDIYNMSELENLGKKHKVIPQAIKEVVETLLSERAICMEKIGTQNIYWAFPSQRKSLLLNDLARINADIKTAENRLLEAEKKSAQARSSVKMSAGDRQKLISDTAATQEEITNIQSQLKSLSPRDPLNFTSASKDLENAKQLFNQWTDNLMIVRQKISRLAACNESTINEQFGIPEDLDYFDY